MCCPVMTAMGTRIPRSSRWPRKVRPSITGICRSVRIASTDCCPNSSRARAPCSAGATVKTPVRLSARVSAERTKSSSSTSSKVVVATEPSLRWFCGPAWGRFRLGRPRGRSIAVTVVASQGSEDGRRRFPTSGASVPRRLSAHRETRVPSSRNPDWPSPGHARGPRPSGALAAALVWSVSEPDDSNRVVPPVQFGITPLRARSTPNPPASSRLV